MEFSPQPNKKERKTIYTIYGTIKYTKHVLKHCFWFEDLREGNNLDRLTMSKIWLFFSIGKRHEHPFSLQTIQTQVSIRESRVRN